MLKRLWLILGPVFCAMAMVALLFFFYPLDKKHDIEAEKRSAVTLTAENFKSRSKKVTALTDKKIKLFDNQIIFTASRKSINNVDIHVRMVFKIESFSHLCAIIAS